MPNPKQSLPTGFGILWLTVALDLLGFGIVIPLLPIYAQRFGATASTIGLMIAAYSAAQLVMSPILGRLSDRIGRKPVLIVSLLGSAVGSLLTGFAGSLSMLFAGRIIDGGSGASIAVAQAAAADMADPEQRPRLMGLLGAAFGIGFVLGPAIGGLASLVSPELPFLIAGALGLGNAFAAWKRLPESHKPAGKPRVDGRVVMNSGVRRLLLVAFTSLVAFSAFEATFALLLEYRFQLTQAGVGLVFVVVGLGLSGVQAGLVSRVHSTMSPRHILHLAMMLLCVGLILLTTVRGWPMMVPALGFIIVGYGLISPTIAVELSGAVDGQRGAVLGVQQSVNAFARIVGPIMGGLLFQHLAPGAPYLAGALIVAVTVAILLPVRSRDPELVDA